MRRAKLLAILLSALCPAQNTSPMRYRGNGHVYFATGACQHGYAHVGAGGGGEAFVWRGLALGGEAGFMSFSDRLAESVGLFATHVGYHFVDRTRYVKSDLFVNVAWMGVGGGLNYWLKPRWGIRTEARLHALGAGEILVIGRIGLAFR